MTLTAVLAPPEWAAPPRPLPRWPLVALALGLALTAGWLWTGHHPAIGPGSVSLPGALRTVGDGFEQTRLVAPVAGAQTVVSLRNTGRLPVTVAAAPDDVSAGFVGVLGFRRTSRTATLGAGPWRDDLTVGPGDEAAVLLRVGITPPYCVPMTPGGSMTAADLPVSVRTLGLTTVQRVPLPLPLTVTAASPACR